MDGSAFDRFTRLVAAPGTRRRVLSLLSALPLAGLAIFRNDETTQAGSRHRRRKKRHHHQVGDGKRNRKGKHAGDDKGQRSCVPDPATVTCAGKCAIVTNNCDAPVDCGSCACTPSCPLCQTCDATTGLCVPVANNTPCDDGNACTQTDTCQSGVCVGTNPILCPSASDPCHDAGSCEPATGLCSNPAKPDGTACDDDDACTQTDTCQAGVCVGTNPVICTPLDLCHMAGVCDPATGLCSTPPIPCPPPIDQCHVMGTCDPTLGTCSTPTVATNGAPCADANPLCVNGTCCTTDHEVVHGGCFRIANSPPCGACSAIGCTCAGNVDGSGNFLCLTQTGTSCTTTAGCPVGQVCRTTSGSQCSVPCG